MTAPKRSPKYLAITGVASAALVAGCAKKPFDEWAAAPGTRGFVNLDSVKEAFQNNKNMADFEKRVNEIFEGDNIVLFQSEKLKGHGFQVTGFEDLDGNGKIGDTDEALFVLEVQNKKAKLNGKGVNNYYKSVWNYEPPKKDDVVEAVDKAEEQKTGEHRHHHYYHRPYWGFMYWGYGWRRSYYTPYNRYDTMRRDRNRYRQTSGFNDQIKSNNQFEGNMAKKHGSGFEKSVQNQGNTKRANYVSARRKSPDFKQSLAGKKSSSGWGRRMSMSTKDKSFSGSRHFTSKRASATGLSKRSGGFSRSFKSHTGASGFRAI